MVQIFLGVSFLGASSSSFPPHTIAFSQSFSTAVLLTVWPACLPHGGLTYAV